MDVSLQGTWLNSRNTFISWGACTCLYFQFQRRHGSTGHSAWLQDAAWECNFFKKVVFLESSAKSVPGLYNFDDDDVYEVCKISRSGQGTCKEFTARGKRWLWRNRRTEYAVTHTVILFLGATDIVIHQVPIRPMGEKRCLDLECAAVAHARSKLAHGNERRTFITTIFNKEGPTGWGKIQLRPT